MNKKIIAIVFALVFLSVLPIAFAGIRLEPTCGGRTTYQNRIVRTEYQCGDCSRGWNEECRTLYKIDYLCDGTSVKTATTRRATDYVYCYNGRFVSFNWTSKSECRGNTSNRIQNFVSPFGWKYSNSIPSYCSYGCNYATGKCNEKPLYCPWGKDPRTGQCYERPNYRRFCRKEFWTGKWYTQQKNMNTGNWIKGTKQYCPKGNTCSNGECITPKPRYEKKCRYDFWKGQWYTQQKNKNTGNWIKGTKQYCGKGASCKSGECIQPKPPSRKCTPRHYTFCKPSEPGKIFIKYFYSDCSSREFPYKTCGSCQQCRNGGCIGPTAGSCTTVKFKFEVSYRSTIVQPIIRNNYGTIYQRSGPSTLSNGCTYNSDCLAGYYCAHTQNRNLCMRR